MTTLHVDGRVKRARDGKHFNVRYLLNGQQRDVFGFVWTADGRGPFSDGIVNDSGIPDGLWTVKITQSGRTIGRSTLTVASDPAC